MVRRWRWILLLAALCVVVLFLSPRRMTEHEGGGSASMGLVLLDRAEGVYILAVSDQSPAHLAGLEPGDTIIASGDAAISSVDALDQLLGAGEEELSVTILRQGERLELTLPCR